MNKKIDLYNLFNWLIAIILVILVLNYSIFSRGSFIPSFAHKNSEKTYHYGPSEIKKEIRYENIKIYLCKYNSWFSSDEAYKKFIKWYPTSLDIKEININEDINYDFIEEKIGKIYLNKLFGYINNDSIEKVVLEVKDKNKITNLEYKIDEDKMFIFYWDKDINYYKLINLIGTNKEGEIVYKENFIKENKNDKFTTYINKEYNIKLDYPSVWKANNNYIPPRYEGEGGFFLINAIGGANLSLGEVVKLESEHKLKPYGSHPTIKSIIVDGIEGKLILPSEDQPNEMMNQAAVIVKYKEPIELNGDLYRYFVLWADKYHIEEISKTIKFIK